MAFTFDAECFDPVDLSVQGSEDLSKMEENAFKAVVATAKSLIKRV